MAKEVLLDYRPQVVHEEASRSMETRRIPDPYWFLVGTRGKLVNSDQRPIEESIERGSLLGKLEYRAFAAIESWVQENPGGTAFWISPPHPDRSTSSKIIASEILWAGDSKLLFNTAVVLDNFSAQDCLGLARNLSHQEFGGEEELRATPIFLNLHRGVAWHHVLSEHIVTPEIFEQIESGVYLEIKKGALQKIEKLLPSGKVALSRPIFDEQLRSFGLLGPSLDSCSPTKGLTGAFEKFVENALSLESSFTCPKCHRPIPSGRGIEVCPHCGARKGEVGVPCN